MDMRIRSLHPNLVLALACALASALFLLVITVPQAHFWGSFLLPVVVVYLWGRRRDIYIVTALTSVLVLAEYWIVGAKTIADLLVNHLAPILILWAVALLLARRRRLQEQLARRQQELDEQIKARTAALGARDEELAKIFRANPGGIAITRQSDGICVDANDAYLAMVGYSRAELVGRSLVDRGIMSAAAREQVRTIFRETGSIRGLDLQLTNAQGAPVDIFYSLEQISFNGEPCYLGLVIDITERKRLAAHTGRLAAIVEASHEAIISADLDGTIVSVNHSAEELYGVSAAEVLGRNVADVALPQNTGGFQEMLGRVGAGEIVTADDATWQLPDGTTKILAVSVFPIRDGGGEVTAFAALARDLSLRKAAERALRASEERFARLFNSSPVGLALTRLADGLFREVNETFASMIGYSRAEIIGRTSAELGIITPADRARLAAALQEQGSFRGTEIILRTRSGELLNTLFSIDIMDFDGEHWLLSSIVDFTARKRLEDQLRAAYQRLRLAADAARIGVWTWNLDDNSLDWDDRMCELYAITAEERREGISYNLWRSRIHPDDLALADPAQGDPGRIGDQAITAYRIVLPGGEVRHIQANAQMELWPDSSPRCVIGVNRDITDQVHYEQLLQDTNAELEERVAARTADLQTALAELQRAGRLKDEFMAMISHELRTPLTGVLSMSEMLEDQIAGPLNNRQAFYVRGIVESGERLLNVINGILSYTHLLSGQVRLAAEPCDLANLLAVCATSQQHKAAAKHQTIAVEVAPPDLTILADATALAEVLKRLLDNAVKFTPEGSRIGLKACPSAVPGISDLPAGVELVVWDTGIGIPADQRDHIFHAFTQADSRLARSHEGLGLGLAYVDEMVRLMGGKLTLASELGRGSRFTITLPA
ncbi:MAG: PAS domain S-box protein [Caldilineaceae bacterium]